MNNDTEFIYFLSICRLKPKYCCSHPRGIVNYKMHDIIILHKCKHVEALFDKEVKKMSNIKVIAANKMKMSIEKIAEIKAKSNCLGVMYEPKKPAKLKNEGK